MSIFWIGNEYEMVPPDRLLPEMWEDRYFLPGILHGDDDYVIRVYLNDAHGENPACNDHDQFEAEYIDRDLILKAAKEDPSYGDIFNEVIAEGLESFGIPNDGDHDFNEIFKAWDESVPLTNEELVYWAEDERATERYNYTEECFNYYSIKAEEVKAKGNANSGAIRRLSHTSH